QESFSWCDPIPERLIPDRSPSLICDPQSLTLDPRSRHNGGVTPLRADLRWTAQAAWRGLVELVNSNDLTHAASIAYYALLSLFPVLLLIISLLREVTSSGDPRP